MRILIADDEELVRDNLRDILRALARDEEIIEAENSRILMEQVRENNPDICFVDIRMPGLSGLDAIEQLSSEFSEISWIILSGHSDFEYARKALTLGVVDYLLKPATEAEVEQALMKASVRRLDAGRLKREKFEYRLGGVINNTSAVEYDDYLMDFNSFAALVFMNEENESASSAEQQRELLRTLRLRLDKNPPRDFAGVFIVLEGRPAVIAAGNNPGGLLEELMQSVTCEVYRSGSYLGLPELLSGIENAPELNSPGHLQANEVSGDSPAIVRQAEKLVLELYRSPVGVAQIAEELNVTPNYLSSLFKKYKKVSFTKFITDIRLDEAGVLLKTPGITVKEAAHSLGYMSSRHFARLFRERYGMTPTDYRK